MRIKTSSNRIDKISELDFEILLFEEYENIKKYNYNVKQMRVIAKHYKLKVSGNKNELQQRLYEFLMKSYYARIIQKNLRKYFVRLFISYKGPAIYDRSICNNSSDFYSLEDLNNISFVQFISFKDIDNFIYGFDIHSLHEYLKSNNEVKNPYNRNEFPKNLNQIIRKVISISKILKLNLKNNIIRHNPDDEGNTTPFDQINVREKTIELFQKIDEFGHITNVNWFLQLSPVRVLRFLRELYDIWNYRAQLSRTIQINVVHPTGDPFERIQFHVIRDLSNENIKQFALKIIENLITKGINHESKSLGVFYVLCALTLVSHEAAQSMPWLYQSVQHFH